MPRFRIDPIAAESTSATGLDAVSRELDDIWQEMRVVRSALRFQIRQREHIEADLRAIEAQLSAQRTYADGLHTSMEEALALYQAAERQVVLEYGAEPVTSGAAGVPEWLEDLSRLALRAFMMIGPSAVPAVALAWGGALRGGTVLGADLPEEYSMFQTGVAEFSGDVFGVPVSIRADLDIMGYERDPEDGYTYEEIKSYLFRGNLEVDVGVWHQETSLGIGNTDSYLDRSADMAGLGILGLLFMPGEQMIQGSLAHIHVEDRIGSEADNKHDSRDIYLGEAHAQGGLGLDIFGGEKTVGADFDYGVSALKFVGTLGSTSDGISQDWIGGCDFWTAGKAYKLIHTDHREEIGAGFGGGELGFYFGAKRYGY